MFWWSNHYYGSTQTKLLGNYKKPDPRLHRLNYKNLLKFDFFYNFPTIIWNFQILNIVWFYYILMILNWNNEKLFFLKNFQNQPFFRCHVIKWLKFTLKQKFSTKISLKDFSISFLQTYIWKSQLFSIQFKRSLTSPSIIEFPLWEGYRNISKEISSSTRTLSWTVYKRVAEII